MNTPAVCSVSRSNSTWIGVSASAMYFSATRAMLTLALSLTVGEKTDWMRLKSERQGSVANSEYVMRPRAIAER